METKNYATSQEQFWANEFGDQYISRNESPQLLAAKIAMFSGIVGKTEGIRSVFEFGCNIGINLAALSTLVPDIEIRAIEINPTAAEFARERLPQAKIITGSISDYEPDETCDLAFTCGVMIHLNPDLLPSVYQKLAAASGKYVLVAEYYNPSPVTINYRGHDDRLFKRDFAGEFMEANPEYKLVDYKFMYRRDPSFPLDDITWFLLRK
jgi:pseudaminic acid biosynthesis-associated methylase